MLIPQFAGSHPVSHTDDNLNTPSPDHKQMGQTKHSNRFPQDGAHIGIGEKRLAPIGVGGAGPPVRTAVIPGAATSPTTERA